MYKVLALDLDGTVLTDSQSIHPEVKQAIQEVASRCHVVIVTGRHHTAARPYYDELQLTTPILCCNGTYIYDYHNDRVVMHNAIEKQNALKFIELAQQHKLKLVMYITDAMVYSRAESVDYMNALTRWAEEGGFTPQPAIYAIDSFQETAEQTDFIWKFVIEGCVENLNDFIALPFIQENFNGERSWSNRVDFAVKGNSKGKALSDYILSLGYQSHDVMAVGDNENDISMLGYADCGVAMLQAADVVKAHAQIVCSTDNNHNGLAHLIREKI